MKIDNHHQFEDQFSTSPSIMASSVETISERHSSFSQDDDDDSIFVSSDDNSPSFRTNQDDSAIVPQKKFRRKVRSYAYRIREHVKMSPRLSETVKGKLSLGAKIIKEGGRRQMFRHIFNVSDEEKLLKASQCYLSTTAGPIAGILFVSTEKVAFCSERPIVLPCPTGGVLRTPYKVIIPVKKIERANPSANVDKPSQKYIQVVTKDNFEFWFMGFVRYEKAFLNLQKAISSTN
nr:GEM-like protein 4 [Ipomoea batatas]